MKIKIYCFDRRDIDGKGILKMEKEVIKK